MPKVLPDVELQERLNRYVRDRGISVGKAAEEFGVNRVSLWRFSATGMARADKRSEYRDALDRAVRQKSETNVAVGVKENLMMSQVSMDDCDLQRIRQACECMLKLLDAYEGRFGGSLNQPR